MAKLESKIVAATAETTRLGTRALRAGRLGPAEYLKLEAAELVRLAGDETQLRGRR